MPAHAADQVELVGVEGLEAREGSRHPFGDQREDRRRHEEDDREHDDAGRTLGRQRAEGEHRRVVLGDGHGEHLDDQDEHAERNRCPPGQVHGLAGAEEPDPDPQEAPQQHEVGEIGQVDDVGAGPADQGQLHEQHQGAEQHQPGAVRERPRRRGGSHQTADGARDGRPGDVVGVDWGHRRCFPSVRGRIGG